MLFDLFSFALTGLHPILSLIATKICLVSLSHPIVKNSCVKIKLSSIRVLSEVYNA